MMTDVKPPGRPPTDARDRALVAAAALLHDLGPGAVTFEAVAARAAVSRPTLYRHWPNAAALTMAAVLADTAPPAAPADGGALDALRDLLGHVAVRFATRRGVQAARMAAAADGDSEVGKAFRSHVMLSSRAEGRTLLDRAAATGEIDARVDAEVLLDALFGALFFRVLVGHASADRAFTDALFDDLVPRAARSRQPGIRAL